MAISFSGVGSGLPTGDWINALVQAEGAPITRLSDKSTAIGTQKANLNTIMSNFTSLKSSVQTFTDANIVSAFDIFGRKKASVSDSSLLTASVSNGSTVQDLTVKISQLASATTASSVNNPGKVSTGDTKITELNNYTGKNGKFSIYINNQKHQFELDGTAGKSTLNDVVSMINNEFTGGEVTASLTAEGKFKLDVDNAKVSSINLGSNTDTSNIFNVLRLAKTPLNIANPATPDNVDYFQSSSPLTSINIHGALVGNDANLNTAITAGTFTIGGSEYTVDAQSTISSLIGKINSDTKSGVSASYDSTNNKLVIKSKTPGATAINIEKGTSNFTDVMGLTNGTDLASGSQVLGNNALLEINGQNVEANSNTVTEDISGIKGLTLNLLGKTSDVVGETAEIKINVQQNTDDASSALDSFIKSFNNITTAVTNATKTGGTLKSEFNLVRLQSGLRSTATGQVKGISSQYNSLASIGVTTGAVGASVSANTNNLTVDKEKFLKALNDNPEDVKALLIGDKSRGITGIMQTLKTQTESSLDPVNGYFKARSNSFDSQMSDIAASIKKKNEYLESYRKRLTTQFSQMDTYISQLKSQQASF
jgi:flagellar hook-associated protein 2